MRRALALTCLAAVLTACGSTVQVSGTAAGGSPDEAAALGVAQDATGAPLLPGATGGGQQTSSTGVSTTSPGSPATAAPGSTRTPAAGSSSATPTAAAPVGKTGRGVTAHTLTLGIAIATGSDALAESFGISGAGTTAEADIMNAVVAEVNRTGGVLGRKLAVSVHNFDAAAAVANPSQAVAEICTDYRDDHKVFAVLFDVPEPGLRKCLAEIGSPLLVLKSFAVLPSAAFTQYGGSSLYGSNTITTERLAKLFVDSLLARSFTQKWNITTGGPGVAPMRLGVIHVDTPDQNKLYADYAKELAKHGLRFTDTVTYTQDASAAVASTQSAVLKFRADGISHVFGASAFFLRAAESQNYRPRYAYLPGLGTLGTDNSPAAQLRGAMTVGWTPSGDVDAAHDPGDNPGAAHCRSVMKTAGLSTVNRTDLELMYAVCDAVFAFRDAANAGKAPTVAALRQGYEGLANRSKPSLTFSSSFSPTRHYGVDAVRDMAFDSTCSCLVYTSRTNRS